MDFEKLAKREFLVAKIVEEIEDDEAYLILGLGYKKRKEYWKIAHFYTDLRFLLYDRIAMLPWEAARNEVKHLKNAGNLLKSPK